MADTVYSIAPRIFGSITTCTSALLDAHLYAATPAIKLGTFFTFPCMKQCPHAINGASGASAELATYGHKAGSTIHPGPRCRM